MRGADSLFREIHRDDESFQLFCSIAAKGQAQGGWENELIARLTPDRELAETLARHAADEERHGRLFYALLAERALDPVRVPLETDYGAQLESCGVGLAHERLGEAALLSDDEMLRFLIYSRLTEQRAADEAGRWSFGDDPSVRRALRSIAADESRHLQDCREALQRMAARGHAPTIEATLRRYARVEARVYRDVSLSMTRRIGEILGWSRAKRALWASRIHASYCWERALGWRRLLAPPPATDATVVGRQPSQTLRGGRRN